MAKYTMEIVSISVTGVKNFVEIYDKQTGLKDRLAELTAEATKINEEETALAITEKRKPVLVPARFTATPKKVELLTDEERAALEFRAEPKVE